MKERTTHSLALSLSHLSLGNVDAMLERSQLAENAPDRACAESLRHPSIRARPFVHTGNVEERGGAEFCHNSAAQADKSERICDSWGRGGGTGRDNDEKGTI